jgi:hypothetical protein
MRAGEKAPYVNLHLLVQAIVHHQTVGHPDAVRLHRMTRDVGVVANIGVVEVGDLLGAIRRAIQVDRVQRRPYRSHGCGIQSEVGEKSRLYKNSKTHGSGGEKGTKSESRSVNHAKISSLLLTGTHDNTPMPE